MTPLYWHCAVPNKHLTADQRLVMAVDTASTAPRVQRSPVYVRPDETPAIAPKGVEVIADSSVPAWTYRFLRGER